MVVPRFIRIAIVVQCILLCALFAMLLRPGLKAEQNGWVNGPLPNIEIGEEVGLHFPRLGNRDCLERTLQTLVLTTPQIDSQTEKSAQDCVVSNGLGIFGSSYLNPHTFYSYKTTNKIGQLAEVVGVPNQSLFLHLEASGSFYGKKVHIFNDVRGSGTFELQNSNTYRGYAYKLNSPTNEPLKDLGGTHLRIKEFAFSKSGEWMVAEVLDVGIARVHLPTKKMALFSTENHRYGFGQPAEYVLAISDDGNTAIKSGKKAGFTRVYDISSCIHNDGFNVNNRSFFIAGCQERSLRDLLFSKVNNGSPLNDFYLHSVRFDGSGRTLEGFLVREGSDLKINKVTLSLDQIPESPPPSYIAMGDSFASGEGDRDDGWYEEGTNEKDINLCHLSKRSYPYLLAQDLGIDLFHSVACSGAKQSHITIKDGAQFPNESPPHAFFPGYQPQKLYLNEPPSFITLSIGGNDVGFGNILQECIVVPGTCRYASDFEDRNQIAKSIKNEFYNLVDTYLQLVDKTSRKTKIFVVGYPEFIQGEGGYCDLNVLLNDDERYFAQEATRYMNDVIEAAAKSAGVYYVDVEKSLEERNLCSDTSNDLMAVNGITLGDDDTTPWYEVLDEHEIVTDIGLGKESYHPNELGHELLHDSILGKIGNPVDFQVCEDPKLVVCPDINSVAPDPGNNYFGDLRDGDDWRPTRAAFEIIELGGLGIKAVVDNLKPGSPVDVEIHSEPKNLGTFLVNEEGLAEVEATIPDDVPPGFHELHFFAENIAGEKMDYFQQIYITGTKGDLNNNGTSDEEESCGLVPESGIDVDDDNIDDSCDAVSGPSNEESDEPKEPGDVLTMPPEEDEEPGIISGVNPTNTASGPQQTSSSLQQTQVSGAQPAATGFQTPTSTQSNGGAGSAVLNQGVNTPSLSVVSAPYSATPSAVATPTSPSLQIQQQSSGMSWLALLIVGGFIVAFSVTAWNRYIKTPVPSHKTKKH